MERVQGKEGRYEVLEGQSSLQEEDYIDMDLSSAAAPPQLSEFEFHMSAPLAGRSGQPLASPADELFYKGKLLPLHLPPRIQMVEELLDGGGRGRVLAISTAPTTPYGSSPANSCFVSGELNVEEYFQEYAAGLAGAAAAACSKKPWARKLRFMRQLNLGHKLKASKAYLKTMFAMKQPGSSDGSNVLGDASHGHGLRAWRKNPFGQIRSSRCIAPESGGGKPNGHRRSFSSVIVRYSASNKTSPAPAPPSCSSSSSNSSTSSSVRTSSDSGPVLRRSSSASSEAENPIQGLIAYCKKSQQLASVRKSASDAGFRFLSSAASKIAAESEDLDELIEIGRGCCCNQCTIMECNLFANFSDTDHPVS